MCIYVHVLESNCLILSDIIRYYLVSSGTIWYYLVSSGIIWYYILSIDIRNTYHPSTAIDPLLSVSLRPSQPAPRACLEPSTQRGRLVVWRFPTIGLPQ